MARILVVDDSAMMRMRLSQILGELQYTVAGEAGNGREAVEKFRTLKPDLVTLDITMPEMDGLEALGEIKKIDPGAKVVMVSALQQKEIVTRALIAGASHYIIKPFNKPDVWRRLRAVLGDLAPPVPEPSADPAPAAANDDDD